VGPPLDSRWGKRGRSATNPKRTCQNRILLGQRLTI